MRITYRCTSRCRRYTSCRRKRRCAPPSTSRACRTTRRNSDAGWPTATIPFRGEDLVVEGSKREAVCGPGVEVIRCRDLDLFLPSISSLIRKIKPGRKWDGKRGTRSLRFHQHVWRFESTSTGWMSKCLRWRVRWCGRWDKYHRFRHRFPQSLCVYPRCSGRNLYPQN